MDAMNWRNCAPKIEQARRQLARGGTFTGSTHDEFLNRAAQGVDPSPTF